jgi:hypothetical protein
MLKSSRITILFITILTISGCAVVKETSSNRSESLKNKSTKHLFILSGQSNMTGGLKAGFAQTTVKRYGKENVVIAHTSKGGRGIRFWDKDYVHPEGYSHPKKGPPSKGSLAQHGIEYGPLLKAVLKTGDSQSFKTVTFIWMQGESDAGRGLGDVYAESFMRVLARLKKDIARKDISFVIGRISDSGLGGKNDKGWKRVRKVQVGLAEESEYGAWINTDDLNGPKNDIHYPSDQYGPLGSRFAEKAIELVSKRVKGQ